jgi:16S rRNA (guanine527-N7)-methyltransferase
VTTPSSREALSAALHASLEDLQLVTSASQRTALLDYLALLERWNATYNLTAVRDPAQMLVQHLADCLAVIGPLRRECGAGAFRLMDVGSGGGLPGVVIAILSPEIEVTCLDAVGKKAAFVRQVAGELKLRNLRAHHARVEQLEAASFDVISSRAFASLADFVRLTRAHLSNQGAWLAMKGKTPDLEIADLPDGIDVFHVEQLRVPGLGADRCIVWMRPKR